jgi:hypothetical protein
VLAIGLAWCAGLSLARAGDTPSPALLIRHEDENAMTIVAPDTGAVAGGAPIGQDGGNEAKSSPGRRQG